MIETPSLVFGPIMPELVLVGVAIVGLLYEAFVRRPDRSVHLAIGLVGLLAAIAGDAPALGVDGGRARDGRHGRRPIGSRSWPA